jgi:hypothetical protein
MGGGGERRGGESEVTLAHMQASRGHSLDLNRNHIFAFGNGLISIWLCNQFTEGPSQICGTALSINRSLPLAGGDFGVFVGSLPVPFSITSIQSSVSVE